MNFQLAHSWAQKLKPCPHGPGEMPSLVIASCFQILLARKIKIIIAVKERYSQGATQESLKMVTRVFCLFL